MFNNKSILITGGTGSFGNEFVKKIVSKYKKINKLIIFSRDELKQYEMAKKFIFDENRVIQGDCSLDNFPISTVISSWGVHYRSWNNVKKNYLLIKYENLVKNPYKEFKKISDYISRLFKINFLDEKIKKSIETNSFENLKKQEKINGFSESSSNGKNFFNLGPENRWEKMIDEKMAGEIKAKFKKEMENLNYN